MTRVVWNGISGGFTLHAGELVKEG
jgi:hypothetical protein